MEWRTAISLFVIAVGAGWTDLWTGKVKNEWILLGVILGVVLRRGGIFSRSCVVWHGGLSAVSFSNDGSRRRKTYVSDRRVSWDLAGMFGDWTWIFDCVSLVNLEDRKGGTGEIWFGRAFFSPVSIRSDREADGAD